MDFWNIHEQYLEQLPSAPMRTKAAGFIREIKKYEEDMQRHFLEMSEDQIVKWLNSKYSISPQTIRLQIQEMRRYAGWATSMGIFYSNPAANIKVTDIDFVSAFQRRCYVEYPALYSYIGVLGEPEDGLAIFPISILAWMGVDKDEAPLLRDEDVDIGAKTIHCRSTLSSMWLSDFMCQIIQAYRSCGQVRRDNDITYAPYRCGRFLYRMSIVNADDDIIKATPVDISSELGKETERLGHRKRPRSISYSDWHKSGRLNKLYRMEKDGIDFTDKLGKEFVRATLNAPKAYPADGMLMYNAYKKAFDLD